MDRSCLRTTGVIKTNRELRIPQQEPPDGAYILSQAEFARIKAAAFVYTEEMKEDTLAAHHNAWLDSRKASMEEVAHMRQLDQTKKKVEDHARLEQEERENQEQAEEFKKVLERQKEERERLQQQLKEINHRFQDIKKSRPNLETVEEQSDLEIEGIEEVLPDSSHTHGTVSPTSQMEDSTKSSGDLRYDRNINPMLDDRVPEQNLSGQMLVLRQGEFDRIINAACVYTKKEKEAALEAQERKAWLDDRKAAEERVAGLQQLISKKYKDLAIMDEDKLDYQEQIKESEKAIKKKKYEQKRLQQDLKRGTEDKRRIKEKAKEEERLVLLHAKEFMRKKEERDMRYKAYKSRQHYWREKMKERALPPVLQDGAQAKAKEDEQKAKIVQEAVERECKKKEKKQALKKVENREEFKLAIEKQFVDKQHLKLLRAMQEKADYDKCLRALQDGITRDKEKEVRRQKQVILHNVCLQEQIREREVQAQLQKIKHLEELHNVKKEARLLRANKEEIKQRKLQSMIATDHIEDDCDVES